MSACFVGLPGPLHYQVGFALDLLRCLRMTHSSAYWRVTEQ